jgi:hypothetical protein
VVWALTAGWCQANFGLPKPAAPPAVPDQAWIGDLRALAASAPDDIEVQSLLGTANAVEDFERQGKAFERALAAVLTVGERELSLNLADSVELEKPAFAVAGVDPDLVSLASTLVNRYGYTSIKVDNLTEYDLWPEIGANRRVRAIAALVSGPGVDVWRGRTMTAIVLEMLKVQRSAAAANQALLRLLPGVVPPPVASPHAQPGRP